MKHFGTLQAAALMALGLAGAAHAGTVLSDNFDAGTPALNWTGDQVFTSTSPTNTTGNPGSVDLIGAGTSWDLIPGHGYYLDMDGTTGYGNLPYAGQITSNATFGAGAYTLSFDLAGNQRTGTEQQTVVTLGGQTLFSLTPSSYQQGFTHYSTTFTTTGGQLQFTEMGPSNQQGNLLDNVKLSAVPEPATWAIMLMGLFGMGAMLRAQRERKALVAA